MLLDELHESTAALQRLDPTAQRGKLHARFGHSVEQHIHFVDIGSNSLERSILDGGVAVNGGAGIIAG
jgi:hypothetical protein